MRKGVLLSFAVLVGICHVVKGQDVISASSGLLHYFEGQVKMEDKLVEHKAAVFPTLKNGSVLRTEKGRAELLLTPDVYLRLDENSSLQMESNSLTDTRLELTAGSAIVDNLNAVKGTPLTLMHDGTEMRFPKPGVYRIDCEPGELQVFSGEAEIRHGKVKLKVDTENRYYFALEMTITKYGDGATDEFYDWAHNRSDLIADQAQMASAENDVQDPDPGISGLLSSPSALPAPSNSGPYSSIFAYPPYGSSAYGSIISPLYLTAGTPYINTFPPGIFVVFPYRHRPPVGTRWPTGTVTVNHPTGVVTRWPAAGAGGTRNGGGGPLAGSPVRSAASIPYRSITGLPAHPTLSAVPPRISSSSPMFSHPSSSISAHPSASHVAAPHIGGIGHR